MTYSIEKRDYVADNKQDTLRIDEVKSVNPDKLDKKLVKQLELFLDNPFKDYPLFKR